MQRNPRVRVELQLSLCDHNNTKNKYITNGKLQLKCKDMQRFRILTIYNIIKSPNFFPRFEKFSATLQPLWDTPLGLKLSSR